MPGHAVPALRHVRRLLALSAAAAIGASAGTLWVASRPRRPWQREAPIPPEGLPPGRVVTVAGVGEMFLRETPAPFEGAPVVLLLHGWMFPADLNWFTCFGPLSQVAKVLAVDHRGHGRGPRPSTPFRLADAADDAAALVRQLGVGPVVAVGYSMGGPVAQLLWQRHPDVVRALVLCATSAAWTASLRMRWGWRLMGLLQVLLRIVPRQWWEGLYEAQINGQLPVQLTQMINKDTPPELARLLPWIVGELDRGSAEDLAEAGRELGRYDARGWLPTVDVPTAVLVTTQDVLVPTGAQEDLASRIPGARTWLVDGDHDVVTAHPERFVPALVEAIEYVLSA